MLTRCCLVSPHRIYLLTEQLDLLVGGVALLLQLVYERLALQMTALDIKSAVLNQPIEVAELRSQFQSALGLGKAAPQLLVRYGYAAALPRSLRRSVEEVVL